MKPVRKTGVGTVFRSRPTPFRLRMGTGGADESTGEQAESADDGDVAAVAMAVLALIVWSLFGGSARSRRRQGGR
jgi:hypothetical protein